MMITEFIAIGAGLGHFGVPPWFAVTVALGPLYNALMTHRYRSQPLCPHFSY